ncbi:hypothetical protein S7711_06495 [Stachybotrys chartarum IBT 7711]|uniref:Aflatoxin regulatory protein domain-containing protein n=1 Tax=Stachybotrys chartarum (strain CBS 109288 / IBT 7711) TaxID=1280523 RepID=A0A084BB79_STACB|nr:hypothetical protein S7711_06495 [Stachybotrys chartarum IBT 7711]
MACNYSISRKIGKPRQQDRPLNVGNTIIGIGSGMSAGASVNSAGENTSASASASTGSTNSNSNSLSSMLPHTWESGDLNDDVDSNSNSNCNSNDDDADHGIFSMDYGFPGDLSGVTLNTNLLHSLPLGGWVSSDGFDTETDHTRGGTSPNNGKAHDCHREAHDLLGTSLFTDPNPNYDSNAQQAGNVAIAPWGHLMTISASAHIATSYFESTNCRGHPVALDQVLLLNRKVIERLASLLACSCAASPYLMMLYASLISAILTRCQDAVDSSSTWNPPISPGGSVAPARISIGAFSVDDPTVQSALNVQLLARELRTVAGLIDMIASYECSNEGMREQSGGAAVPRLYQSLAMWLKGEHSRVTELIRRRLRELNT